MTRRGDGLDRRYLAALSSDRAAAKEFCDEFRDDAVIPAEARRLLIESRERLDEAASMVGGFVGPIARVAEADESLLRALRQQIRADEEL